MTAPASGLADDIERFLNDETVEACPPSTGYRFRKFARRHKGPVTAVLAISSALVLGIIGTTIGLFSATRSANEAREAQAEAVRKTEIALTERERAQSEAEKSRRALFVADWHQAQSAWDRNDVAETIRLLRKHEADTDLRGFEWFYLWKLCQQQKAMKTIKSENAVWSVGFAPDRTTLVYGESDGEITFYDLVTGTSDTIQAHDRQVVSLSFSPDGMTMASASFDCTVKLWDVETRENRDTVDEFADWAYCTRFSPGGDKLAVTTFDGEINVYEVGEEGFLLKWPLRDDTVSGLVHAVAFSPDGKTLASAGDDPNIKLWNIETGELFRQLNGHDNWVFCLAFSHDGRTLATGGRDTNIILWDTEQWTEKGRLDKHMNTVFSLDFDQDDQKLASGSTDHTVRIWDVESGIESSSFRGHSADVFCVRFSQDAKRVVSCSLDKTVKLWDVTAEREANELLAHTDYTTAVAFSPAGDLLASASFDRTIRLREQRYAWHSSKSHFQKLTNDSLPISIPTTL